jgi:hypothetical protein
MERKPSLENGEDRLVFHRFIYAGMEKPRVFLFMSVFIMDTRDILFPIGFNVTEFIEDFQSKSCLYVPVLNSFQYQDKEVGEKKIG